MCAPQDAAVVHVAADFVVWTYDVEAAALDGVDHVVDDSLREPGALFVLVLACCGPAGYKQVAGDVAIVVRVVAPMGIRGYGSVKEESIDKVKAEVERLLSGQ